MDHTDFVEIHNYGSKRGRRRVRIPKTRVKTAPLEFEDVGTTTGEISRWLPEGQIQQLGKHISRCISNEETYLFIFKAVVFRINSSKTTD